jgi:CRISP-associated protein Cas1
MVVFMVNYIFSMLSLSDIRYRQILFIHNDFTSRYYLSLQAEHLVMTKDKVITNRVSTHKLLAVFIIGQSTLSTSLIKELISRGTSIYLLKASLEVYAQIDAQAEGHYILRHLQYTRTADTELDLAKQLVANKIRNQLYLIRSQDSGEYIKQKRQVVAQISQTKSGQELLSIEGRVAREFFGSYFAPIGWLRRQPQVRSDIPNFMLDIGYSLLFNLVDSMLRLHGFDTYKGVYHKLFFARRSLACDIMEPFRCIVDKAVLKAYNLNQIDPKDFNHKLPNLDFKDYKTRAKYSELITTEILVYKLEIFTYIHDYYRHFMRPDRYKFPHFYIR